MEREAIISYEWDITMTVLNKKRKVIWHDHFIRTYAINSEMALELAKSKLPKHLEYRKWNKMIPRLAVAYWNTEGYPNLTDEELSKMELEHEQIND